MVRRYTLLRYGMAIGGALIVTPLLFLVLVDKPVTASAEEATELWELANSRNLVLYPFQNRRWDSDFLALRRLLSEPLHARQSLGDLFEFESQ